MRIVSVLITLALALAAANAFALEETKQPPAQAQTGEDLRAKVQNPVGSLISVPFKLTVDFGAPDGSATILNLQPVIPQNVGDWNLIHRAIAPILAHVEGFIAGIPEIPAGSTGGGATGIGDINYSVYLSPAYPGKAIWGVGPSINLPTATDDQLGSGKWSGGLTAVVLTQPKPWTLGVLGRQLWSFAGDSGRPDVNQFLLEPFVNYNLDKGWYLISDIIITANWDAPSGQQWTIPLGGGFGRIFKIGKQSINSRLEAYYNIEKPDAGPDWSMSFTFSFLFPK